MARRDTVEPYDLENPAPGEDVVLGNPDVEKPDVAKKDVEAGLVKDPEPKADESRADVLLVTDSTGQLVNAIELSYAGVPVDAPRVP